MYFRELWLNGLAANKYSQELVWKFINFHGLFSLVFYLMDSMHLSPTDWHFNLTHELCLCDCFSLINTKSSYVVVAEAIKQKWHAPPDLGGDPIAYSHFHVTCWWTIFVRRLPIVLAQRPRLVQNYDTVAATCPFCYHVLFVITCTSCVELWESWQAQVLLVTTTCCLVQNYKKVGRRTSLFVTTAGSLRSPCAVPRRPCAKLW